MRFFFKTCIVFSLLTFVACSNGKSQDFNVQNSKDKAFRAYWFSGTAELNRYTLEQARYGEIHQGDAVLIFVTEDFLSDKQVKFEGGNRTNEVQPVLKLNFTKKFLTGIYPYSMMASTFTPVDNNARTLKTTTTSQEWCGHTFTQLNLKGNKYRGELRSYFMREGDQDFSLDGVMLEDEVWTKIRLAPNLLPTGQLELIPGSMFLRLRHRAYQVETANASLKDYSDPALSDKPLKKYRIEYTDFNRILEITYEADFPHAILAWEEHDQGGGGQEPLVTKAVRTHSIQEAYWNKNGVADKPLRGALGLD